ncbi:MAG: hypothetical protein ACHQDD_08805 [Steroidobacterales bacterium]
MVEGDNKQNPTASGNQRADNTPTVATPIPDKQTKPECHCCKKQPGYKIALEVGTFFFALAGAVIASFAVHYYNKQWQEMHQQTVIQRNASINSERAWVALYPGPVSATVANNIPGPRSLKMDLQIRNDGKTPGKHIVADIVLEVIREGQVPSFSYDVASTQYTQKVLFASSPVTIPAWIARDIGNGNTEPRILSAAEWQELMDGKGWVAAYGRVAYDDIFGKPHWQHFCTWFTPLPNYPIGLRGKACSDYNDTDNSNIDEK